MKIRTFLLQALVPVLLALVLNGSAFAGGPGFQDKNKTKIPEVEAKAVSAVEGAADIDAKITAAADFVTKYPKSTSRQHVAEYIVDQILAVKDPAQKLALAQKFPTVFTANTEAELIKPALIDAYLQLNRFDEAFAEGAAYLAKKPDDISVLVNLTITGTEQAKKQNPKYVNASRQYGARAIEQFEANKKPAGMDDAIWEKQKALLPQVYQEMAIVSLMEQKPAEAQVKLEKATKSNPADPFNYMLLGSIANDEYQKLAVTYKGMAAGKEKDDALARANALLDKVIDYYAHGVGLAEGKPQYQNFHDQLLQDLASYYRYRHSNSSDGLQKLIDSYKQP
ncbi:MAG: hypothetical protein JWM21_3741 [Acidobacteria bacterium]|nr:hypothetical protein [Acidobacteriota bacterium]